MNLTGMKAAVFDLGGTLLLPRSGNWYLTEPVNEFLRKQNCTREATAKAIAFARKATADEVRADTREEEIRIYSRFYRAMADHLGKRQFLSDEDLRHFSEYRASASELYILNWPALKTIQMISPKMTTALFSNTWPSVIRYLHDERVIDLFTCMLFSCETGLKKPDPRFFQLLLDTIRCKPEEIVLYDDSIHVAEAAADRGILARLVTFDTLNANLIHDFFGGEG